MNITKKILFFFVLPIVAVLIYPPEILLPGIVVIAVAAAGMAFLGWSLLRGKSLALTFSIFMQGLNVIIRVMMFFSNSTADSGAANVMYIITALIGIGLSFYLMLRLDGRDVRLSMTS